MKNQIQNNNADTPFLLLYMEQIEYKVINSDNASGDDSTYINNNVYASD